MSWFGRRKTDPPVAAVPPKGAASEPPVFTPNVEVGANILSFPDPKAKKLSDANRAAVHALLDQLLDQIGEDEYLVMGIEGPDLAIEP